MRTYGRQSGITMIGFAMVLGVVGFFAYGFMKLYPAYAEYFGVVKSMKSLQGEAGIENASIDYIRRLSCTDNVYDFTRGQIVNLLDSRFETVGCERIRIDEIVAKSL